ncbi:MAG: hypothetical protein GOMPHAMPRED_001774 [Gomphillus americanus]|uniref:Uncharacterized protein n=1 Tax=Gomphillus americanus TaxID=1940652 RepID=A0A8H3IHY2_9LECA|nr:MAG: hypothetical protein GOMPHAMPRED_001774 [Gomphillus americanus]
MSFEPPTPPYNASDPHATFLNSSCFDFLLIEVVPLAYRTAAAVTTAPPPRVTLKSLSSAGTNTAAPTAGLAVGGDGRGGGAEAQAQAQAQGQGKKVSSKQKPTSLGVGNATNTTAPGGGLAIGGSAGASIGASAGTTAAGNNNNNNNNTASAAATTEDDAQREIVSKRLEALGYRVGQGLVER